VRVLFAGSPHVALPSLRALREAPCDVVGVITQPAQPMGRKRILTDTPVGRFAKAERLPLATPQDAQGILECVREWKPDIAVVVAYGRLLPPHVLEEVPRGWWNVHFSLLPQWRGAAPVPHAILAGDDTTGVTLFRLDSGLDTGAVALVQEHDIAPHDTATTLLTKLSEIAVGPVLELVARLGAGEIALTPQSGQPSFAPKPDTNFGWLDWRDDDTALYRRFRAATVEPGAFTSRLDSSSRVKILSLAPARNQAPLEPGSLVSREGEVFVGTGGAPLLLEWVQPAGKGAMSAPDWFRGLPEGVTLGG
jgi:methionyl-tRNA formyltransferase